MRIGMLTTTLTCPNCGKEFETSRQTFYEGYRGHCAWCGQVFEVKNVRKNGAPSIRKVDGEFVKEE